MTILCSHIFRVLVKEKDIFAIGKKLLKGLT